MVASGTQLQPARRCAAVQGHFAARPRLAATLVMVTLTGFPSGSVKGLMVTMTAEDLPLFALAAWCRGRKVKCDAPLVIMYLSMWHMHVLPRTF